MRAQAMIRRGCLLATLLLLPAAASAQSAIAGLVTDNSGRCDTGRHGRSDEPRADREGQVGGDRRPGSLHHH